MFLNLLFTEAGKPIYRTYVYGLEGKHWDYNGDEDTITLYTGSGDPGGDWDYGNQCWTIGTCEFVFNTDFSSIATYEEYREREKTAYYNPMMNFRFNDSAVSIEEAQIQAVKEEYWNVLANGVLGVDGWRPYFEEFQSKLAAAGLDAYQAEVQRQLNEYVAANNPQW